MLFIFDFGFINSFNQYIGTDYNYTFLFFCVIMPPLLAFYRLVYIFWTGMMPAFFYAFINVREITPAV
ncbi:TPA: hypothetical protein HNN92_19890 [Escherichia coli]|nr:hypothetical protein [Escherichia coli]PND96930.1 hypothetical protein C1I57_21875 [Escherichia coli]HAJ7086460.1 hypothetical protein [Escherichia coli]